MSNTLIFGGSGQLGQCLRTLADRTGYQGFVFPQKDDADILNEQSLNKLFEQHQPDYCINCAAYTAVDKAEDEIDLARNVNRDGAGNLAKLCNQYQSTLIQISTDFVFGGNLVKLLTEDDQALPVSVYGLTKLEGELILANYTNKYYILRTSWLYSEYANNFVKTMLKLGSSRTELNVIADQVGTPTYGMDLAAAILHIITNDNRQYGVYHYSNEGVISWYDFAVNIFDIAGVAIQINPIRTSQYPSKATRPKFSAMDKTKIKNNFQLQIPYWRESLVVCIKSLNE